MNKFKTTLTDSPINEGSLVEIDINTVKPGTTVAILTPVKTYNTMIAKRKKYINFMYHLITGLIYDSVLKYYCSRNLIGKILALKDAEFEEQYKVVRTAFDYATVYLGELSREKEAYEEKHGRYGY